MRNFIAVARHEHGQIVAALNLTIFGRPDPDGTGTQLRTVVEQLETVATKIAETEADLLAHAALRKPTGAKSGRKNR